MTDSNNPTPKISVEQKLATAEGLETRDPQKNTLVARQYVRALEGSQRRSGTNKQSRTKLNEEEAKLVKEKKVSLHDMVNYKREILLSKIKIENKKKHMKDLEEYVNGLEKQINHKMETMNKNTNIVRKNFHELKKDVEQLKKDLNDLENSKKDKLSQLSATENEIYQRELEKRKAEEEAKTYTFYKEFILSIYDHFSAEFDEKAFRHFVEKLIAFGEDSTDRMQFYLTENKTMDLTSEAGAKEMMNPVDYFLSMLETIEDDNFTLIYQLQNKQINNFELDRKNPEIAENSTAKLEELERNHQELLDKEKELREKLKEKTQYEKEVLNEVISSKDVKKPSAKNQQYDNDENAIIDVNEVKKKLIEIVQAHELPYNTDMSALELLKLLETYFEKMNYDASLIANTYPDYYHRKLREHITLLKKDNHKTVEHKSKKKNDSNNAIIEERVKQTKMLKSTRRDMKKHILKREKKTVAKNDFDPEKYEHERYFT